MPSESIITIRNELAKAAGGDGGATGQSTGEAGKSNWRVRYSGFFCGYA